MKTTLFSLIAVVVLAAPAFAKDPVEGVWQAPPDAKGQIGHIEIKPCGAMMCGTIIKAYAPNGQEVVTPNVGKRLFWDMSVQGGGNYGDGRVYVPAHRKEYDAKMKLSGNNLKVKGCVGPVCQGQIWKRVK
ncbi:DUF2147 domain-containing protein [Roseovarius pelagicus]|uniref:DUF2147 domain-containing protein n=1 Tax=Roseovarius pelagicus TaxID=2980108 RepID=A0ABY6DGN8_9RHOB|nr:DUF2147 domain-containing protein [Roseovarius pelagicus]UXX84118.1 DUF2147 domain-containing protein [Roseovarius pelagicus]